VLDRAADRPARAGADGGVADARADGKKPDCGSTVTSDPYRSTRTSTANCSVVTCASPTESGWEATCAPTTRAVVSGDPTLTAGIECKGSR
jgi:hypothetical protein